MTPTLCLFLDHTLNLNLFVNNLGIMKISLNKCLLEKASWGGNKSNFPLVDKLLWPHWYRFIDLYKFKWRSNAFWFNIAFYCRGWWFTRGHGSCFTGEAYMTNLRLFLLCFLKIDAKTCYSSGTSETPTQESIFSLKAEPLVMYVPVKQPHVM